MVFNEMFRKGKNSGEDASVKGNEDNNQVQVGQTGHEGVAPQNSETPTPQEAGNGVGSPATETQAGSEQQVVPQNGVESQNPSNAGGSNAPSPDQNVMEEAEKSLNQLQTQGENVDFSSQQTEGRQAGNVDTVVEPNVGVDSGSGESDNIPNQADTEGVGMQPKDQEGENPAQEVTRDFTEKGENDGRTDSEGVDGFNAQDSKLERDDSVVDEQPAETSKGLQSETDKLAGEEEPVGATEGVDGDTEEKDDKVLGEEPAGGEENKQGESVLENSEDKRSEEKAETKGKEVDLQAIIEEINSIERENKEMESKIQANNGRKERLEGVKEKFDELQQEAEEALNGDSVAS